MAVAFFWLVMSAWCIFKPSDESSVSERRKLAQMPQISVKTLLSGEFMSDYDLYLQDQFPRRDTLRTVKAVTKLFVLRQGDNNGIYVKDGYASKIIYPLNKKSVNNAAERLTDIYEKYFKDTNSKLYLTAVPDKGYFLAEKTGHPEANFDDMTSVLQSGTPWAEFIDITDTLSLESYYRTDTHWRETELSGTAKKICSAMGADTADKYETVTTEKPFYGVYYGQSALPLSPDTLSYLTNKTLDGCKVFNYETNKTTGIYNLEKLDGTDPYDLFLSGSAALLTIENPTEKSGRELIVFRDSFGSSIVPLLLESYSKVTVVDTRYITPELIGRLVTFNGNEDVLFIYSSLLLNDSYTMKK